jgi:tRNA U34 2-thiouridine synthase MnmA/TrmU
LKVSYLLIFMINTNPIRALVLFSGGLDSQLVVCLLKSQGIQVTGITFQSIFFDAAKAEKSATRLDIPLRIVDFTAVLLSLLEHPRHGFGAGLNPCLDCHTAMLRQAGEIMRDENFHFVATGEVLNERPMSQTRRALKIVAEESGLGQYLLRPLSARLLDITEPERKKWVDREKLLSIEGRGRKPQMALAQQFGLLDYPHPAGGCLLTDPGYGRKLRDLRSHEGLKDIAAIQLLRVGRHFRLGMHKLIVGRNEAENEALEHAGQNFILLKTINVPGPTALLAWNALGKDIQLAAAICARYSDHTANKPVAIEVHTGGKRKIIEALPADQVTIDSLRV